MAALYPMRPAGSYTTPWDTISNAVTGEIHPPELFEELSDEEIDIGRDEAEWAAADSHLKGVIADACWWSAQIEILTAWDPNNSGFPDDVFRWAMGLLNRSVEVAGLDPRYLRTMAWACLTAQRPQEAFDAASESIAAEPSNPEGWRLKGNAAFFLGRLQESEYCLSTALKMAPGNPVLIGSLKEIRAAM
jgi:tetratricopeptide (TPR) repeat protein